MAEYVGGNEAPQDAPKITVSSLTFTRGDLAYFSSGTPTACGDGTDCELLVTEDCAITDTELNVIWLKDGDLLWIDYTGATTNVKTGDYVDFADETTIDATDETAGVERLQVMAIDSANSRMLIRYRG